jgi:glycosyltransferase involved in cell wall biosynthesis
MNDKIALYVPNFTGAGAQRVILNLACGLSEIGIEVDVLVANAVGELIGDFPKGPRLVNLKSKGTLASLPRLIRYLKSEKPYAMLSTMINGNVVAIIAKMLSRTKVTLIASEVTTQTSRQYYRPSTKEFVLFQMMKLLYKKADLVIANSHDTGFELIENGIVKQEQLRIIHNPIVSRSLFEMQRENISHPWFQEEKNPIIISVGRLHKLKDFETLIRAFSIVRTVRIVRLVIFGEGEDRERLQYIIDQLGIAKDVDLPGFTNNPHAYLYRSSVFVLCSKYEGFGNVLVEALAAGIPVVASNCPGGPKEILDYGKIGQLVPVGDYKGYADAIIHALDTPPDKKQLIQRSKLYSMDAILPKYIAALNYRRLPKNSITQ